MATKLDEGKTKVPHDIMVRVRSIYPSLKSAEIKAADFFLANPDFVAHSPITAVAQRAGCSEPTFLRLARKLGFQGYTDFKEAIITFEKKSTDSFHSSEIEVTDSFDEIIKKVFTFSIQTMEDTFNILDRRELHKAVKYLKQAKRVIFFGTGAAFSVALMAHEKFTCAGIENYCTSSFDEACMLCSQGKESDVLFVISHTGQTRSVINLAKFAKMQAMRVISLTNYPMSALVKNSDIVLLTAAFAEHFDGELLSKRMAELCLIECVYTALVVGDEKMVDTIRKKDDVWHNMNGQDRRDHNGF